MQIRGITQLVGLVALLASTLSAAEHTVVRIGTGGTGGTYFPIGSLIAQSIGATGGARRSATDESVPGLLAVAQISNGSVANAYAMRDGRLHAALMQSNVAYWAYRGSAIFRDAGAMTQLRTIAHLYPESLHLVARNDSGIASVADLAGKRVSLDEPGSGTVHDARFVLQQFGLSDRDMRSVYLKPHFAVNAMERGELDAFFIFAGYPVRAIERLAGSTGGTLVPIDGPAVERLLVKHPYFSKGVIPYGTYGRGIAMNPATAGDASHNAPTHTVTVGAQLMVHADLDQDLVYAMTRALWSKATARSLARGHPKGSEVRLERALSGISVPLHPGAARFYADRGMSLPKEIR